MSKLHVICMGNICRSPMAAAVFVRCLPAGSYAVESAGLSACEGQSVHPFALSVMRGHGLAVPAHAARQFRVDRIGASDLVLAMEHRQLSALRALAPQHHSRMHLLGRWKGDLEIRDPSRKMIEDFERTFLSIEECVGLWCAKLAPLRVRSSMLKRGYGTD